MSETLSKEQIEDLITYCGSSPTHWRGDDMSICCPVHGESNPSCGISYEKQVFHCFSCGASGDFSKLLIQSLPEEFGYDDSSIKSEIKARNKAREFLKDRYELEYKELNGKRLKRIKRFDEIMNTPTIELDDTIPMWKIAPYQSGKNTYKLFFNRGFTKEDLVKFKVGYDEISRTITLPVFNEEDKLLGVIGRYIGKRKKNERYKIYDNFNRSKYLYPLNHFKVIDDTIIIIEGQLDAIKMHSLGYTNALALMTDLISTDQANFIVNNCSTVIYIGDNDTRGIEAMQKNYNLLKDKVRFLIVDFPEQGKDVCEWSEEEIHKMISTTHSPLNRKIKRI